MIPTLLLFGIKNKYKKRDITSQILYHVIDQKKHERIGFMSHNNCILTLLDLKDKNINFSENWMKDVQINGIRSEGDFWYPLFSTDPLLQLWSSL